MTRSDPTGRAYRDALVDVRASVPAAAQAIAVHVAHLERLLTRTQLRQHALEAQQHQALDDEIDELAFVARATDPDLKEEAS